MQEILTTLENDSTMMLIVGVSIAIFLVIFLVLLVSAIRVKGYKDNYRRIDAENKALIEERARLEKELKVYKITDQKNKKELSLAEAQIRQLKTDTVEYAALKIRFEETDKMLHDVQESLKNANAKYDALEKSFQTLEERYELLEVENTKNRSNNARLLMKLEQHKGR